ncbi:MAG: nucleotidyltransferase domain-containing protein [Balneolaceae bacterium]|nr:nucleotidyltransferase domain-containing protein [Balneolaceae bacterium]MBO6545041.1 nucleotidyltransferase domain-containing protein [Balneolaceae bacterium]MBO6646437.1 nucleotidyltransferase domain-containing protein [Balneolaceae bacterium]
MEINIKPHHKRTIENLTKEYRKDSRFLALIIGGSVAKQCARDDSDVDFMIIATDDEYEKREQNGDLFINRTDLCDYSGGYVDGKVINLKYLQEVADRGNEPSRAAFDGAFISYSHLDHLEEIFKEIHVYPEKGHYERLKSFYCMAFIQNWLMGEASRHENLYTQTRAASQLALFAGRLVLAHNRILFPYHKWLIHYLEKCPEKPSNFINNIEAVLKEPNSINADQLFQSLRDFNNWGITDLEAYSWFMTEVEWSWRNDKTPLEDL